MNIKKNKVILLWCVILKRRCLKRKTYEKKEELRKTKGDFEMSKRVLPFGVHALPCCMLAYCDMWSKELNKYIIIVTVVPFNKRTLKHLSFQIALIKTLFIQSAFFIKGTQTCLGTELLETTTMHIHVFRSDFQCIRSLYCQCDCLCACWGMLSNYTSHLLHHTSKVDFAILSPSRQTHTHSQNPEWGDLLVSWHEYAPAANQ